MQARRADGTLAEKLRSTLKKTQKALRQAEIRAGVAPTDTRKTSLQPDTLFYTGPSSSDDDSNSANFSRVSGTSSDGESDRNSRTQTASSSVTPAPLTTEQQFREERMGNLQAQYSEAVDKASRLADKKVNFKKTREMKKEKEKTACGCFPFSLFGRSKKDASIKDEKRSLLTSRKGGINR